MLRIASFFLICWALLVAAPPAEAQAQPAERPPNIIIIFADDLGYGDLGCYGHPTIRTPNLDRMAAEGTKLTQFYAAASVCTPSRAGLLTGRYPIRSGMGSARRGVLFPNSKGGLPDAEITIAELLKPAGYATACVGKWHLGHLPPYLPTRHGFDEYFGIPYSNDMKPCPLMRNEEVLEEPADQKTLTKRYTQEAVTFIEKNAEQPFFLYMPHTFPHIPLFASEEFRGKSPRGLYGDAVEELDWSVGQVLDTLKKLKLDQNTFVFFTSDNGPWLIMNQNGGSAGLLRDGKGCTWDGGMREPALAWWPGTIPAGVTSDELSSTLDLLPTCAALAGVKLPEDRPLDGYNMRPFLTGEGPNARSEFYFYRGTRLMAARMGPWKAHFITQPAYRGGGPTEHDPPVLYNLGVDPGENYEVGKKNSSILDQIKAKAAAHTKTINAPPSELEK